MSDALNKKRKIDDCDEIVVSEGSFTGFTAKQDGSDGPIYYLSSRARRDEDRWQEMPSFDQFPSLQVIDLYKCRYVELLHESITNLKLLRSLRLVRCSQLKAIPANIGTLTHLEEVSRRDPNARRMLMALSLYQHISFYCFEMQLDLTDSAELSSLPDSIGELKRLAYY